MKFGEWHYDFIMRLRNIDKIKTGNHSACANVLMKLKTN